MIGVVADDITGSGDIGIMFAKAGMTAQMYSFSDPEMELAKLGEADVVILDTNSRFDEPETAYSKVYDAVKRLQREGVTQFINKTCSVFRGNIGAEFDAMLDALGLEFAVVVLGFPKNGRTTVDGIHYVHGVKLEQSEFANDPVHPMRRSDLVGILQAQTKRRVASVGRGVVARGPQALRDVLDAERAKGGYVIVDVTDQEALAVIARATVHEPVLCGASALSEELAPLLPPRAAAAAGSAGGEAPGYPGPRPGTGILVAAGSLMPQTAAQIRRLAGTGVPAAELDAHAWVTEPARRESIKAELVAALSATMRAGGDALVHTPFDPAAVERTKEAGRALGLSNTDVSRLVSAALADVVAATLAAAGQNRAVIAGGDTSAAVCARLGVTGLRVHREIAAGLPSCWTLTEPPLLLVLKSGSFGTADFFERALFHLKES